MANLPKDGTASPAFLIDVFNAGSYSYVAVGATAETYDSLAKPVHRRVLFAGEHTCKVLPF